MHIALFIYRMYNTCLLASYLASSHESTQNKVCRAQLVLGDIPTSTDSTVQYGQLHHDKFNTPVHHLNMIRALLASLYSFPRNELGEP